MEKEFVKITNSSDYTGTCSIEYENYFQLHIYSYSKIISTYYLKSAFEFNDVKSNAHRVSELIQNRSILNDKVGVFENDCIILITDSKKLVDIVSLFDFDLKRGVYEDKDNNWNMCLLDVIGGVPVDTYIKNILFTIGAGSLYPTIEPLAQNLLNQQIQIGKLQEEWRLADKTIPKYHVEFYKIEKNKFPLKNHEFHCGSVASATCLPENKILLRDYNKTAYIIKEVATGEIVENSLIEKIGSNKYIKWQKNHTI